MGGGEQWRNAWEGKKLAIQIFRSVFPGGRDFEDKNPETGNDQGHHV